MCRSQIRSFSDGKSQGTSEGATSRSTGSQEMAAKTNQDWGKRGLGERFATVGIGGALAVFGFIFMADNTVLWRVWNETLGPKERVAEQDAQKDGSGRIGELRMERKKSLENFKESLWQQGDPMSGKYDEKTWKNKNNHGNLVKSKSYRPGDGDLAVRTKSFRPKKSEKRTDFVYDGANVPQPKTQGSVKDMLQKLEKEG